MIVNLELTESGSEKFNKFFHDSAKDDINIQAVLFEVLDVMQERAANKESFVYELGHLYTKTGRPEHLHLSPRDVKITEEDDD